MKRFIICILCVAVLGVAVVASAASKPISLIVDGKPVVMDVEPVNVNDRVMVPARFVAEALGATVSWDDANQTVVITSKQAAANHKVGDILPFAHFTVQVASIHYETGEWAGHKPAEGRRIAVATLVIITDKSLPADQAQSPLLLVKDWQLASNTPGGDTLAPGPIVSALQPFMTRVTEVGYEVGAYDTVAALTIGSPYAEDNSVSYRVVAPK